METKTKTIAETAVGDVVRLINGPKSFPQVPFKVMAKDEHGSAELRRAEGRGGVYSVRSTVEITTA